MVGTYANSRLTISLATVAVNCDLVSSCLTSSGLSAMLLPKKTDFELSPVSPISLLSELSSMFAITNWLASLKRFELALRAFAL